MAKNPNTYSLRLSNKEKTQMMGNLSTMLRAGVPILEAVDSLLGESKGNLKKILEQVKLDLQAGTMIHESFAKFPKAFNKVTVNLIKAAEEAGTLEIALKDAQETLQKEMEFEDKVKSAMMYPAFVMLVFAGVLIMMLVVVMPRISQVFSRLQMELPLPTRILIFSSDFLMGNLGLVVGLSIVFAIAVYLIFHFQNRFLLNILFSLPIISGLVREIDLTRFARSMALLLNSGLPIVTALELSEDVVSKKELKNLLISARGKIAAGKKLSEGLRSKDKIVPGIVIKLIEVGETTGSLQQSMKDVADMLDYEVTKDLKSSTALLEPIMLVVVALAVGGMMLSIIGPIYGLISDVGQTR